jgi:hemoglobin
MRTSHSGLQITESEWQASIEITRKAVSNHSVGLREQSEFLAMFEQYKNDIVGTR